MEGKKSNKSCHNAFYYFMRHLKTKQGGTFLDSTAAGPLWEKMSAADRKPYEIQAQQQKGRVRDIKYTSQGLDIEVVHRREEASKKKESDMIDDINGQLAHSNALGNLNILPFYLVHVNHFCFCNSNDRYYPAELAVIKISLENGVRSSNVFHMIIKPGDIPLGYTSDAKQRYENVHLIRPPIGSGNENNCKEVFTRLRDFLNMESFSVPPLYADNKNRPIVENVLNNMCLDYDMPPNYFKIYSAQQLLFTLRNAVAKQKIWPSVTVAQMEFEKDVYEYTLGIACDYHESGDSPHNCSLSHVTRQAYIICDNCCGDLGINLIPGMHVPKNAKVNLAALQNASFEPTASSSRSEDFSSNRFADVSETEESGDSWSVVKSRSATKYPSKSENEPTHLQSIPQAVRSKRPTTLAQAKMVDSSQSDSSSIAGFPGLPAIRLAGRGRGRGRGVGANFPKK